MPLNKSKGNMYPWVTHTHTHLGGECSHRCSYCYVNNPRFGRPPKFSGPLRLLENEFNIWYGKGRTIFMENCNDLFAMDVPGQWIRRIVDHVREWPDNTYVWQTKNPGRYLTAGRMIPANSLLGCTVETNRPIPDISAAPHPMTRLEDMQMLRCCNRTFITIEPILDFDLEVFAHIIRKCEPEFVNIGADSKGHGLKEPTYQKIMELAAKLNDFGIEIREKHNLERLAKEELK